MNGPCQEIRSPRPSMSEERRQEILTLLVQMIHRRLTASRIDSKESAAKKRLECPMHLRDALMP